MRFQRIGRVAAFVVVCAPAFSAAAPRAFVKSTGSDANPCTLQAPCRLFTAAIAVADAGGEVIALDSGGFDGFTVNKALTILAPDGVFAGVATNSGTAISVNAGPSDVVILRGLTIKGRGAARGVVFASGAALHVEKCDFTGFSDSAIRIQTGGDLYVSDTTVRETGHNAVEGVASSGTANLFIDRSRIERSAGCALVIYDGAKASITETHASKGGWGFCAQSGSGTSQLDIRGGSATGMTNTGVGCSGTGTTIHIADALVTNNGIGFVQSNGCTFESLGNNLVRGNTNNVSGTVALPGGN